MRRSIVTGNPLPRAGRVVFDGCIIIAAGRSGAESSNIDIAQAVNGDGEGIVVAIARSIVARNPLLHARGVVLDRGIIKTARRSGAIPSNIDIARAVNGNGRGNVIGIAWSIVAGNLLLYARGVVLDRGVIFAGT